MRILKLDMYGIHTPEAKVYKNKQGKLYFNYHHGLKLKNFHLYTLSFSTRHFLPKSESDKLILKDDNYIIMPIIKDGEKLKDNNNNILYNVHVDNNKSHIKDVILFWEVPNRNYSNIKYKLEGDVELIAEASSGITRSGKLSITPMPVLDIFGDCKLSWNAVNSKGENIEQTIEFNYYEDRWDMSDMKIKGVSNG